MARDPQTVENSDHKESKGMKMAERSENARDHGESKIAKTNFPMNAGPGSTSIKGAVKSLERQTERGAHVAEVGGHKMHGHSGRMMKD